MRAFALVSDIAAAIAGAGQARVARAWGTAYRGPVAIVAACPVRAVVATAQLVACEPAAPGDEGAGEIVVGGRGPRRQVWRLAEVRALACPIPCSARPGLWDLPESVARQLAAAALERVA